MKQLPILALDLETTGLIQPNEYPGIVQIGLSKPGETISLLINPEKTFEEQAQKVTGLSQHDIEGAPTLREALLHIADFMRGARYLVTYNGLQFDVPVLFSNLVRYGIETRFPWPPIHYDLMSIRTTSMTGKTGNKPPKLEELYMDLSGQTLEGAHDAGIDAQATLECAMALIDKGYINV